MEGVNFFFEVLFKIKQKLLIFSNIFCEIILATIQNFKYTVKLCYYDRYNFEAY